MGIRAESRAGRWSASCETETQKFIAVPNSLEDKRKQPTYSKTITIGIGTIAILRAKF